MEKYLAFCKGKSVPSSHLLDESVLLYVLEPGVLLESCDFSFHSFF